MMRDRLWAPESVRVCTHMWHPVVEMQSAPLALTHCCAFETHAHACVENQGAQRAAVHYAMLPSSAPSAPSMFFFLGAFLATGASIFKRLVPIRMYLASSVGN